MQRTLPTTLLACLLALCAAPAAHSSTGQQTIFQDDGRLLGSGPDVRDRALDEIAVAGADVIKLHLVWSDVAPGGATRPEGFQGQSLSSYSEAAWERYDGLIRAAVERGFRVLVAPTTPAPGWATAERGDERGVYRPNARELGRFVRAAGTRYDGAHGLPRVDFWTVGNEPNHPEFLQPLGSRRGHLIGPHTYRELVRQAVAGLRLSGHSGDTILFGELLPIGQGVGPRTTIKPVAFLRDFFCLDRRLRPYRGRAARLRDCDDFKRITGVAGFGYHPYTRAGGPRTRERSSDDATIRSLSRITRVLDRAAALRRLSGRRLPIYNTEFAYQSDPPDPFSGAPLRRIPAYLAEAEWISYHSSRVASWSQYGLVDDPLTDESGLERYSGFQSGLRFADGRAKDGVYDGYRLPFFVRLLSSGTVEVWGGVRAAGGGARVQVQSRTGSGDYRDLGELVTNAAGYFAARLRVADADRRTFRFVYEGEASRSTNAARR